MRYVQAIEGKSIRIDAKDRKILAAIAENARSPATVIAKRQALQGILPSTG